MAFRLAPQTVKQLRRFRGLKRGYYSLIILVVLLLASLVAELLVNSRAIVVHYDGEWYFPTYGAYLPGKTFGLDYDYETNYRELKQHFEAEREAARAEGREPPGNWLLLPPVPYNAFETDFRSDAFPPYPPSFENRHFFGTDVTGRDLLARLVYGFRLAMAFSLILLLCNYVIGIALGCAMGYFGGAFDLLFQRLIEIWSNVPFLYVIMIVASIIVPNFWTLLFVMVIFGWMGMTWYMRRKAPRHDARRQAVLPRDVPRRCPLGHGDGLAGLRVVRRLRGKVAGRAVLQAPLPVWRNAVRSPG